MPSYENQPLDAQNPHNILHEDLENQNFIENFSQSSKDSVLSNEIDATVNLILLNKLSWEMGFPRETVKHILINYKAEIGDNIEIAIDFCLRANEDELDDYITDEGHIEGKS